MPWLLVVDEPLDAHLHAEEVLSMRKLSLLSTMLVIGLVVGLVGFSFAVDTRAATGSPSANWSNGSGGNCWIDFTARNSVDLTNSTLTAPYPADTELDSTGNQMTDNNNCKNGVTVKVEVTDTSTPTDFSSNVLDGFRWQASTDDSDKFTVNNGATSYSSFLGANTKNPVGTSSNPAKFDFSVSYDYTIDNKDIVGGYSVSLQYTVSKN